MSLNHLRKRPGINPDDNSGKRPRLGEKSPNSQRQDSDEDVLSELSKRTGNTELPVEEISTDSTLECDETSSEYDSSDDEDFSLEEEMKVLANKDPDLHVSLKKVHEEIKKTEPNVLELLKVPLRLEDRAKLCQFYEIYKSTEPCTLEWLDARMRYNAMFKEFQLGYKYYEKFTEEEHEKMKEEERKISSYNPQLTIKYNILSLETSQENKAAIYRRYEDLQGLEGNSEEYSKLKQWLTWATSIPHDKIKRVTVPNATDFILEASKRLDKELFGMRKVKEQVLLFLSARIKNPELKRCNLGLVGPPGVGKTQIARMIAGLMNWGFEQISFGGVDKADFLKGHEYTYVGAQPGAIVKALRRMGHKNGVIFLDELEKAAEHPDVRSALLHLVDQSQNQEFRDNFLGDVTIDLSHIWYVASMNKKPKDSALADRWWVIEVPGYDLSEKVEIIQKHLLPDTLNASKIPEQVTINRKTCEYLISKVCKSEDKGVRTIQKSVSDIINKIDFLVTHQNEKGELPFSSTFKIQEKLSYPLELTKNLIDGLIGNKELNTILNLMYL